MHPPIPPEALNRIAQTLEALEQKLRPLLEDVPEAPDSAIQFCAPEEP